jgi:uncharacterized membrane protein
MFRSRDVCAEYGGWQTMGWWSVYPGSCTTVYQNSLRSEVNNRFWYYYAENDTRSYVWKGNVGVYVTDEPFNSCLNIGRSDARIVLFKQFDVGNSENFTMTLH